MYDESHILVTFTVTVPVLILFNTATIIVLQTKEKDFDSTT